MNASKQDVLSVRERIAAAKQERALVARARVPLETARRRLAEAVDRLCAQYEPTGVPAFGEQEAPQALENLGEPGREAAALAALVGAPRVYETLERALSADYARRAGELALDPTARQKRLAALDESILALEIDEERLITELEAAGVDVDRRGDADPGVVLAVP